MKKIYLDYSASTPISSEVLGVINRAQKDIFGNPGSLHYFGQKASKELDITRNSVAGMINADFHEIIFTSSATEANNIVIRGVIKRYNEITKDHKKQIKPKIIVSAIEHESIMETVHALERDGEIELVVLPVNKQGLISPKKLERLLDEKTILVSVMYANNVIGSIEPIQKISKIIKNFKKVKYQNYLNRRKQILGKEQIENYIDTNYPLFHTDAVQAFQYLNCDTKKLEVDFLTLSSHKIYGPKGVGVLFVKQIENKKYKDNTLSPIITGGGQEFKLRSGTENVPLIIGFNEAVLQTIKLQKKEFKRITELKLFLVSMLNKEVKNVKINGGIGINFLPNIINLYFPKISAEKLLILFDINGISISSGSACSVRSSKKSHIFTAILKENREKSSIRISMGRLTTKAEIIYFISVLKRIL